MSPAAATALSGSNQHRAAGEAAAGWSACRHRDVARCRTPVTAASGRLMVWANGFSLSLASCCGVGPPVSCAAALAATTEPVTIPSSARRRASLLLVKMRFKPSSAQSASLPDIRVLLPHRRLDALHRCPPITPRAASTRRPFWWQATPARRSLGTRPIQLLKDEFFSTCRA
jgi:hypothetical protein